MWHKQRGLWHEQKKCDPSSCACSESWFTSFSSSRSQLRENLLCQPVACPELCVDSDEGTAPKLHKPDCSNGECNHEDCLKAKMEKLRNCKTEFSDSTQKVRYRKYAKMPRKRNDGTEYFAVEFVYVEESEQDFATTMLSAAEAALAHEGAHFWFVRTRDVALHALKHAPSFVELAGRLGKSQEEAMQALLSTTHENHLTFTDDDEKKKIDHARC